MAKGYEVFCRSCGCQMRLRKGKYGEFWGCTGYPRCRNTMSTQDASLDESGDIPNNDWGYTDYYLEPPDGSD